MIFFPSNKKFESTDFINSYNKIEGEWKDNIINSKYAEKWYIITQLGLYIEHWNLLRMTIANDIMWCDIFHLFVEQNKKTVMEGNCWLNINIEGHTDNVYCLFWYFKITPFFSLTLLFYYIKIIFSLLVVWRKKSLSFHGRDIDFFDGIVLLTSQSFYDIIMTYIFQQLYYDIRVQQLSLWKDLFHRKAKFP